MEWEKDSGYGIVSPSIAHQKTVLKREIIERGIDPQHLIKHALEDNVVKTNMLDIVVKTAVDETVDALVGWSGDRLLIIPPCRYARRYERYNMGFFIFGGEDRKPIDFSVIEKNTYVMVVGSVLGDGKKYLKLIYGISTRAKVAGLLTFVDLGIGGQERLLQETNTPTKVIFTLSELEGKYE